MNFSSSTTRTDGRSSIPLTPVLGPMLVAGGAADATAGGAGGAGGTERIVIVAVDWAWGVDPPSMADGRDCTRTTEDMPLA